LFQKEKLCPIFYAIIMQNMVIFGAPQGRFFQFTTRFILKIIKPFNIGLGSEQWTRSPNRTCTYFENTNRGPPVSHLE
jgi:hypothetical protein